VNEITQEEVELKECLQDLKEIDRLVKQLIELSNESAKSLLRTGGMLNKDLAYDITKTTSKIAHLGEKYESLRTV
jgi:hypothetical protein